MVVLRHLMAEVEASTSVSVKHERVSKYNIASDSKALRKSPNNTRHSPAVTGPTTTQALFILSMGEETRPRAL